MGAHCEALQREEGFDPLVTPTGSPTRVILTVRAEGDSPEPTAFFDPDPAIAEAEAQAFFNRVEGALTEGGIEALSLSGSSPSPSTHALFSDLIALAQAHKVPVFLDTYGAALSGIWGFWPDLIQLNRREAAAHLRNPDPSEADLFGLLARWSGRGVRLALVTDGPRPVLVQGLGRRGASTLRRSSPSTRSAPAIACSPAWWTAGSRGWGRRNSSGEGSAARSPTPSCGMPGGSTRPRYSSRPTRPGWRNWEETRPPDRDF